MPQPLGYCCLVSHLTAILLPPAQREARLAEQQRVLQEQAPFQPLLEEEEEEGLDGMEDAAEADKDAALRSLVQNLREKGRQPGSAAAAADDDDDEPDDDEPPTGVASSGNVAVEADFIIEQRPGQGVPDVQVPEPPKPQISRCVRSCLHMARALGPVPRHPAQLQH